MIATNYSAARDNFKLYCDKAVYDCEPIIVTRKNSENVVIMSEAEYSNMLENLYIRSNESFYRSLLEAVTDINTGKLTRHELIEVDDE